MMHIFSILKEFIYKHKIISAIIILILIGGLFLVYKSFSGITVQTKYVLTKIEKGTIVSSLSSSGQVSALNQIDIKVKASGDVVYVGATDGQTVSAGQLLVKLDTTDAQRAIKTAEQNLASAKISLQKLQGDSTLSVPRNKQDAQDSLTKDYESGYNSVANAFIDLPEIMTSINDILYKYSFNTYQENIDYYAYSSYSYNEDSLKYKDGADKSYKIAKASYDKNFSDYKATSRFSDNTAIDSIITETYATTKDIAQAVKDANNLIQFYKDVLSSHNATSESLADTHLNTLSNNLSKVNSNLTNLLNSQSTIKNDKDALADTDLDIESQKLSVRKAEDALTEAKQALSDYYVYAPFSGIIATMDAKVGQTAPSPVATIITETLTAEISFGETDIAKIKIGQKANLTFDAVEDLTITGKVSEIDTIGTSSQGVVSYNVKVVMDIQDNRIKPGMSTTAVIITDTKTDALYVPNSALKTQQGSYYVLRVTDNVTDTDLQNTSGVLLKNSPSRQAVEIGLADDSSTEITSGLSEGDVIVSSTLSSATSTTKTSKTSTKTNSGGGPGMGGIPGL